jgi:putative methionine-R-sulfoxide reductase with GAF domain
MYDPLVVDTFARVHREIAPQPAPVGDTGRALEDITSSNLQTASPTTSVPPVEGAFSVGETLRLFESAHALARHASISDTFDLIAQHLHQVLPSDLCVFYSYDAGTDDLEAKHVTGAGETLVKGTRIELGHRLSGWVAANRLTIANSDPVLDLGNLSRSISPPLKSSLSTPLVSDDELLGVLTLYSKTLGAFGDNEHRVIEAVAAEIAFSFKCARDFESGVNGQRSTVPSNQDPPKLLTARR